MCDADLNYSDLNYSDEFWVVEFERHGLNSPLHFAAANKGHNEIVALLLHNGADVNSRNYCVKWWRLQISSLKVQTGLSEGYGFHSDNVPDLVDVTNSILHDTFSSRFPSVKAAKVVSDANTERSTGYVFIRFVDDNESSQAMTEMNGVCCSSRPMLIGAATPSFFLVVFNLFECMEIND
ncbi:hypothetical protein RIF29_24786 [Crotalaria pallida]|uniref:RRM domain-containing protein n=1 Tax=Crotalaria pallida TaxID=3830 RepID=A0AAN9EMV0_CROPI